MDLYAMTRLKPEASTWAPVSVDVSKDGVGRSIHRLHFFRSDRVRSLCGTHPYIEIARQAEWEARQSAELRKVIAGLQIPAERCRYCLARFLRVVPAVPGGEA